MTYVCCVCSEPIKGEDPHTYHDCGCRLRALSWRGTWAACAPPECDHIGNCGQDCHAACCPLCTGYG